VEADDVVTPPVVGVVVVHDVGDWFGETLDALAVQDYPNLKWLWVINGSDDLAEMTERIHDRIPGAFVRYAVAGEGFGESANEVLDLVEGNNGYFWICHDDVAPSADALRLMMNEMAQSNAGVVGPKLLDWEDPRHLQSVGFGVDRCGELVSVVEPGEMDQQQHDGRRDVFMVPSACMLVRADLFRSLEGFDPHLRLHGEDLDLCWRAHQMGARVLVVPAARVRHRQRLIDRRPDLDHLLLSERHRIKVVATNTSGAMWGLRMLEMWTIAMVSLVAGLFGGRTLAGAASMRGLFALGPRVGTILAQRRRIARVRLVPESVVSGLQQPGSARWKRFLRHRQLATYISVDEYGVDAIVRRWRNASYAPVIAWFLVVVGILVASRTFITAGVPAVGEFLPFPDSPREMVSLYASGWDPRNGGATAAAPTGWVTLAVLSALAGFQMDLALTMSIVGLYLLGAGGAWRLAGVFPTVRAQVAGLIVYVATPLVPGVMATGSWSALVWYATLPWCLHLMRRVAGIGTAEPSVAARDLADAVVSVPGRERLRLLAVASVWIAVATAMVPSVVLLWLMVGLVVVAATVIARGSMAVAGWFVVATVVPAAVAAALNLPWVLTWRWTDLTGVASVPPARGIIEVLTLSVDDRRFAVLGFGMYLAVVAGVLVCRAWRLTWAVRAAALVIVFAGLAIAADRGSFGFALVDQTLLLVPVALGLSIAAAAVVGGFGEDVSRRGFGWRQPVALLAHLGLAIGVIPAVIAVGHGAYDTPANPSAELLQGLMPRDSSFGDYRVLIIGDPRVMPVSGFEVAPGVAAAVVDAGELGFLNRWSPPHTPTERLVQEVLSRVADGETLRAGRLLAAAGILYVVVPEESTPGAPDVVPPEGLIVSLRRQFDLGETFGAPSLKVFVNNAWFPAPALLSGLAAEASLQTSLTALASLTTADLFGPEAGIEPVLVGATATSSTIGRVGTGVVHLGTGFDERWVLRADGVELTPRRGLVGMSAFDVVGAGPDERPVRVELVYVGSIPRRLILLAQALGWLLVLTAATRARITRQSRPHGDPEAAPLLDFDELEPASSGEIGERS
jgi:GT2 family glycosyltransferase